MHANMASGYCYATLFGPLTLVPLTTYRSTEVQDREGLRGLIIRIPGAYVCGLLRSAHCIFQVLLVRCARLDQLRMYTLSEMCRTWW